MSAPELTVVVPSHDRGVRLRWLLNALEAQDLAPAAWEAVVAHDPAPGAAGEEERRLLATHPLARDGRLRAIALPRGTGPAAKRNAAWRAARGRWVVFTDDDCRPPPGWLAGVLAAVRRDPAAVVQGATRPDPDERHLAERVPHARTQEIEPPTAAAQTCNIAYPRVLLERLGGFDERLPLAAGEDTDLAVRARAAGASLVPAPEALTFHAVEAVGLLTRVREAQRWQHLALLVRLHPELRRELRLGVFWKPRHARLPGLLAGVALAARGRPLPAAALAAPWIAEAAPRYGRDPRGLARAVAELPGRAVLDLAELVACARGSVRHRTLIL